MVTFISLVKSNKDSPDLINSMQNFIPLELIIYDVVYNAIDNQCLKRVRWIVT